MTEQVIPKTVRRTCDEPLASCNMFLDCSDLILGSQLAEQRQVSGRVLSLNGHFVIPPGEGCSPQHCWPVSPGLKLTEII